MPRRTTLTYSSEDAPDVRSEQIYVYYCKCGPVSVASARPAPQIHCLPASIVSSAGNRQPSGKLSDTGRHTVGRMVVDCLWVEQAEGSLKFMEVRVGKHSGATCLYAMGSLPKFCLYCFSICPSGRRMSLAPPSLV